MMYYGPYSDSLSTFTLLKQIAQIPQNLLLARVKAYMPMMYSGLPDSASEQDALDYAKGHLMIADRGYEVSSDGLERVLGAPVTVDTQFAADALSKRMQECTSLGALIEQLEFPQGEWGLLKYCLTTKNLHLGKLLGLEQLKLPISTHDAALRAVASRIIGHTLSDMILSGGRPSCQQTEEGWLSLMF